MPGLPLWDGSFTYQNAFGEWFATDPNTQRSISGNQLCNARVYDTGGGIWEIWIIDSAQNTLWNGHSDSMSSPLGVYTRSNAAYSPETLTLINNPDPVQVTAESFTCPPS